MKNINHLIAILFFIGLAFLPQAVAQEGESDELSFEVNRAYPSYTITKEQLQDAQTIPDLYTYYKASWVKEYISVEILVSTNGTIKKAVGENDRLNQEQKDLISKADVGTDIAVKVTYLPENNLKHNEPKEINFTFRVDPESGASYVGGEQQLRQYLKKEAIDKITKDKFEGYDLTAINFTINEKGQVVDAQVHESLYYTSKFDKVDQILLEAICNMPNWQPAQYANGVKAKQEFVLAVGNMESCIVNLLQIRQGRADGE